MKPMIKPKGTAEQRAEEEAIRRQHAANPVRQRPAGTPLPALPPRVGEGTGGGAILKLLARFKAVRESQGLTLVATADISVVPLQKQKKLWIKSPPCGG